MQNALFSSLRPIVTFRRSSEKVVNDLVHWFLEMGVNDLVQWILTYGRKLACAMVNDLMHRNQWARP